MTQADKAAATTALGPLAKRAAAQCLLPPAAAVIPIVTLLTLVLVFGAMVWALAAA
jgi:hypothetical protein